MTRFWKGKACRDDSQNLPFLFNSLNQKLNDTFLEGKGQTWIKYIFDMTGFFEGQNLTQKHRDSRQNGKGNQSKKPVF